MMKLYEEYAIGDIVSSTLTGYKDDTSPGVTHLTVKKDNMLHVIITNQTADPVDIPFRTEKDYMMMERSELYVDPSVFRPEYADNWYDKSTGVEKHEAYSNKVHYKRHELCDGFSVKPYSLTIPLMPSIGW